MIPGSLTSRILLGFAALGTALLLSVGGTLFVVLHELHLNEIKSSLGNQVVLFEAALVHQPGAGAAATEQVAIDYPGPAIEQDGGFILAQGPAGAIRILEGNPSSLVVPASPTDGSTTAIGTLRTSDGKSFVYIEPAPSGTHNVTFVFAVPDRSVAQALGDMGRAMLIVALILLILGIPIAWLLSRSLTGPMRRLSQAAADLPSRTGSLEPLPVEGPVEVRAVTERFNAMARELESTRHEEAQMLANLRHDLRTPLTSIAGFAEAIADGTATGERATFAARTIAEESQRLERLVGELGVVERLRQGPAALRPESLDATALLDETATRFEGQAGSQKVQVHVGGATPGEPALAFTADRLACERILQNLVANSLSVLPKGGNVWLAARRLQLPGRSLGMSLSVTDDGPGFPPGTTEKVFERFYRADPARSGSGSGLGLAIVRELARAHGGEAWAENVAPHGARVTVVLPIVPAGPAAGAQPGAR